MIQRSLSGRYYCDGRGCGTDLRWFPCDPEDGYGAAGELVCMDCNSSIFADAPTPRVKATPPNRETEHDRAR